MANGFSYVLREGGVVSVPATNDISDTLLIIGSALDGPDGVPIPISSVDEAVLTFGPVVFDERYPPPAGYSLGQYSGNNLVRDIDAAFGAGCNRVIAVRVGGEYAKATIPFDHDADLDAGLSVWDGRHVLVLRGLFKGAQYNGSAQGIRLVIAPGAGNSVTVTVGQTPERGGSFQLTGLTRTTKIGALIALVNNDARNLSVVLELNRDVQLPPNRRLEDILDLPIAGLMTYNNGARQSTTYIPTGGKYGIKQEATGPSYKDIYSRLVDPQTGVFANIEGIAADYVLLSALYADDIVAETASGTADPSVSVFEPFARFVARLSELYPCHGVMGLQPLNAVTPQELREMVMSSYLANSPGVADSLSRRLRFGYFLTEGAPAHQQDGIGVDFGRYVSIVAGLPAVIGSRLMRRYVETPHASYAGMLTMLAASEIPAFRAPLGLLGMAGPRLQRDLVTTISTGIPMQGGARGGALVVIERNVALNNDLMVINDVTAAQQGSMFSWLSNVRIANIASRNIQLGLRPFLGKPNTADTLAAMASVVRSILDRLANTGALLGTEGIGYRFSIEPTGTGLQMTQVRVLIDMRPSAFIRAISVEVTVRP